MERKAEFVKALRNMVAAKGVAVYTNINTLKNSLPDYVKDSDNLKVHRMIFYNTLIAEASDGGALWKEMTAGGIKELYSDVSRQKTWLRRLTEVGQEEEKVAFTIVCFRLSLTNSDITESVVEEQMSALTGKIVIQNTDQIVEKSQLGNEQKNPSKNRLIYRKRRRRQTLIFICCVIFILIFGIVGWNYMRYKNEVANKEFDKFESAINENDIISITDILNSKSYGKNNTERIRELICSYISENIEEFNKGRVDFDISQKRINAVKAGEFVDIPEIDTNLDKLISLNQSKKNYRYGKEYQSQNKYDKAIELYSQVIESDINYDDAKMQMGICEDCLSEQILEQYHLLMEKEQYYEAKKIIATAMAVLDDPRVRLANDEVSNIINDIEEKEKEQEIKAVLLEINVEKNMDFPEIIARLNALENKYPNSVEVNEALTKYKNSYSDSALNGVDEVYVSNGVEGVIASLQEVYYVTKDDRIEKEILMWNSRTNVVNLSDIEPFHEERLYISDTIEKDNWGNSHNSHIYISDFGSSGYIEYNVKNIDEPQLQFILYVPEREASILPEGAKDWEYMSAKVYGDDVEIWSSGSIDQKMEPQLVRLDVSEYSFIKICLTGRNDSTLYDAWSCHVGDLQLCW